MSLGERITALRANANMTQADLSRLMNISRQAVSKWEQDKSEPDTLNLIRLADILATDIEYLATGKHGEQPKIVTVEKPVIQTVEKPVYIEKIVPKPVVIEKRIEIERPVERYIEKPVLKRVYRTRYKRNPLEFLAIGIVCFLLGILIGLIL